MGKLTGQTIAASYDQLLIVDHADGISASLQAIESADTGGSASSLKISTSKVEVIPASNSTSLFEVSNAAGTPVLSVDTSNVRVGINTDSPTEALHVVGDIQITDAHPAINFTDSDDNSDGCIYHSAGNMLIDVDRNNEIANSYFRIGIDDVEKFRISSDGSVASISSGTNNTRYGSGAGIALASGGDYNAFFGYNQ